MSKSRIYIGPDSIGDFLTLDDRDVIHKLKDVLRCKEGSDIYVFDGKGKEYIFKIKEIKKNTVVLGKVELSREENFKGRKIALGFPLVKEDKIDFILQKATELGVYSFIPFVCQRSINVKPSAKKLQRWQRIVIEAARQSERLWIPEIEEVLSFTELIAGDYKKKLVACAQGKEFNPAMLTEEKELLAVVGPEGDFSDSEYRVLGENDFQPINLSEHILRVETAAVFFVGMLNIFK